MIICDSSSNNNSAEKQKGLFFESGWAGATFLLPEDQLKRTITIFLSSNVSLNESLKKNKTTKGQVKKKSSSFNKCQIVTTNEHF